MQMTVTLMHIYRGGKKPTGVVCRAVFVEWLDACEKPACVYTPCVSDVTCALIFTLPQWEGGMGGGGGGMRKGWGAQSIARDVDRVVRSAHSTIVSPHKDLLFHQVGLSFIF